MEKFIDFVELPANITLTFFEENPVYFWTGILSILMIVWVGKLIIEKSKPKPKFKIDDRVQYAGKIGTVIRYDRKHFLPYVVWFDDGTSDQFEELTLKPVKLKWVKPKTCTELELNQEVKICSDLEQSEEGGKIFNIFSKEPKVMIEFEDYWSSRFLNLKLDQILILKEFTDSQFYNLEDEKVEKLEGFKVGDVVRVIKIDDKIKNPIFQQTLLMIGKVTYLFNRENEPYINVYFSETDNAFAYYPEELEKVENPTLILTLRNDTKFELLENPKVVETTNKFPNDHIPMKLETYKNGNVTTYKVDEIEVSKEEYDKLSKNFKILTSNILENFEVGYGKKIKSKDSNKKLEDTLKSLILKSFK